VASHLGPCADQRHGLPLPPTPRPRARQANAPHCEARDLLHRMSGVDLTALEGLDATTALTILRAIGLDLRRLPSLKHCCRGLGRCPPHTIAAGQLTARPVRPGATRVAQALRLAARARHHAKPALGGCFRRLQSRLGPAQALTAPAHRRARRVYPRLKHGTADVQPGLQEDAARSRDRDVRNVARKARALGVALVPATTCSLAPRPCPHPEGSTSGTVAHAEATTPPRGARDRWGTGGP
jgi:transposase